MGKQWRYREDWIGAFHYVMSFARVPVTGVGLTALVYFSLDDNWVAVLSAAVPLAVYWGVFVYLHTHRDASAVFRPGVIEIGVVSLFVGVFFAGIWHFAFPKYCCELHPSCMRNQHLIGLSISTYLQDYGCYPTSYVLWSDGRSDKMVCPDATDPASAGYGYNSWLPGLAESDISDPSSVLVIADGGNDEHLLTGPHDIDDSRHIYKQSRGMFRKPHVTPGFFALFADGHAEWLTTNDPIRLEPESSR